MFLERVKTHLPEKAGKIEHHIREVRGGGLYKNGFGDRMSGTGTMADMVEKLFRIHARKHGLDTGERMGELEARGPVEPMGAEWVEGRKGAWQGTRIDNPLPKGNAPIGKPLKGADPSQLDLFAA